MKRLWLRKPKGVVTLFFILALILSSGRNARFLYRYLTRAEYSFAEMSEKVRDTIVSDPESRNILMGHFSMTVQLYCGVGEIIPMNERFSPAPLAGRLEELDPRYLVAEGEVDDGELWGERKAIIDRYYELELLETFNVFDNYRDYPIFFYRLIPLEDAQLLDVRDRGEPATSLE